MKARRSEAAIVLDVLEALASNGGSMNMTMLSQVANLSYSRLSEIVEKLEGNGVVRLARGENRKEVFITKKGLALLAELRRLKRLLDDLNIRF